jgi:CTP synthase (UTP-ammonia lyase)
MMKKVVSIGIIGDFDASKPSHKATNEALEQAADSLSIRTCIIWMPTDSFTKDEGQQKIDLFDSIWASPGSPYVSMEGALNAIARARLLDKPFFGT